MAATGPTAPEFRRMSIRLPRPLWIGVAAATLVSICVSLFLFNWVTWVRLDKAIIRNDVSAAATLLRLNPALAKQKDANGDTALALAAERDCTDIVRILIKRGSDMYHDTGRIGNPCNYAAWFGSAATMQCFVEAGYNLKYQPTINAEGTCLHQACWRGNAEVVKLLIDNGADVNALTRDGKETPLMRAVCPSHTNRDKDGKVETVRLLLRAGARQDLRSESGETALEALRGHLSRLKHVPPPQAIDENTFEEYRDIYLPFKEIEQLLLQAQP